MSYSILVVTPLYKIVGRKDLIQDSECIHTLVKYWKNEHEVDVLYNYINGLSKIKFILSNKKIKQIINGYNYECDGINVTITERQNIFPGQINGLIIDRYLSKKIMKKNKLDKNYKYALVHLPSTSQYLINNLNNVEKKIAVIHQTDLQYLRKHKIKFKKYLEKNFDKVFCRSSAIYEEMKIYKISNLSQTIISSGVNTSPSNKDKEFNKNNFKFLYVGKLIKRKNLDILIKALSKLNQNKWELKIIGSGPMEEKYKNLVKQFNLEDKIKFLGKMKHENVLKYMEESDIFCMPSINETLGLVYLEAMSRGCITIGTKKEGIDGIIKDSINGYLINANENDLLNCINNIYNLKETEIVKISKKGIETAIRYNEKDVSEFYLKSIIKESK